MAEVDSKKPALIGGLIVGLLSALPFVQMANLCFCLWAVVGGAVAAKLLIDRSPQYLTSREGAKIGVLAGLIGGAIYFVIEAPITIWQIDRVIESASLYPFVSEEGKALYDRILQNAPLKIMLAIFFAFVGAIFLVGFSTLGGILGVVLFEKRKEMPPPPQYPPQSGGYGEGQGGWPQG
jgi:hypothetical protein